MNIIISPAKKMRTELDILEITTLPPFYEDAKKIKTILSSYTRPELKTLFAANDAITELNYQRYQTMDLKHRLTPAVLAYIGLQYQSMAPDVFDAGQWTYIREHLKIISGLYGVLRACDGVVSYRLEMQARLSVDEKKDLYDYWGDRIFRELTKIDPVILNLASKEYSKAVEPFVKAPVQFVTCIFGELQDNKVNVKATAAKMARGDMVRWLAANQINQVEKVKNYQGLGYHFDPARSTENKYVFD